ncbi:P-loop NTPase fold protein [Rhodococcus sp. NPDC059968]|uniref:P-loop NTPase fold protein n=1 Tax=Rhodococcus sp. NPDC059968 TaxID=3347017 RepID=UPI00366C524B
MSAAIPLAKLLEQQAGFNEAEQILRRALSLGETSVKAPLGMLLLRRKRNRGEAVAMLREAVKLGDMSGAVPLGEALLRRKGGLAEAEQVLRMALDSGDRAAAIPLSEALLRQNRLEEAEDVLMRSMDWGDRAAAIPLAKLLERQNRLGEAEQVLERSMDWGDRAAAIPFAELLERQNRLGEAEEVLERAMNWGDRSAAIPLSELLERQNRLGEAEQVLERVMDQGLRSAAKPLSELLEQQNRLEEAEQVLERAMDQGLKSAAKPLSELLQRQNRLEEAEYVLRRADGTGMPTDDVDFENLDSEETLGGPSLDRIVVPAVAEELVAGPDRLRAPDRLGIEKDARALAALVSSRKLEPPLAIALYGEWGSGKTFFMNRIEAAITDLATHAGDEFQPSVAHVRFSAWHYARGNLWASLLEHIFAELHPRLSKPEAALAEAITKIEGVKQVVDTANARVKTAQRRSDSVDAAIKQAEERHGKALKAIRAQRDIDLWAKVTQTFDQDLLKDQVKKAAAELGLDPAMSTAQEMAAATRQIIELGSRVRVLATAGKSWWKSPLALSIVAAVLVGAITLVAAHIFDVSSPIASSLAPLVTAGSGAAAWIARQAELAKKILAPAEQMQKRIDDAVAAERSKQQVELESLRQEAASAQAELIAAVEQKLDAETELNDARKEKKGLTGDRLLRRYLAERAGSGDYEEFMGVVALAHRDLRDLSDHLRFAAAGVSASDQPHLNRIVLYIDDLDRCEPDTVADVLDAVHLLLALPLFVVIVGVDPRWLKKSLRHRHPELLEKEESATTTGDYLEKIFQLTYTLPPMSEAGCAAILRAAAGLTQLDNTLQRRSAANEPVQADSIPTDVDTDERSTDVNGDSVMVPAVDAVSADEIAHVIEALTLSDADIEALERVAVLVASTPRRAKRFLNVYLVVRARILSDEQLRPQFEATTPEAGSLGLVVLIALLFGVPKAFGPLLARDGMTTVEGSLNLRDWSDEHVPQEGDESSRLQSFLLSAGPLAELRMASILQWGPVVVPYAMVEITKDSAGVPAGLT